MNYLTKFSFIGLAKHSWPRLDEAKLSELSEEERADLREWEEAFIAEQAASLEQTITVVENKFDFAKVYKKLARGLRNELEKPPSEEFSPAFDHALRSSYELAIKYQMKQMEQWFHTTFADASDLRSIQSGAVNSAIENYAGKDGRGCAGVIALVATIASATATLLVLAR